MAPDEASATLAGIRERSAKALPGFSSDVRTYVDSANDVPFLLAAVEAVLKLADDWDREAREIPGFKGIGASAYQACAKEIREAITTALAGKE